MTLTTRQAAALAGLHYVYFRALLARGEGPRTAYREGVGRGGARFFEPAEVERWARERAKKARAEKADTDRC